MRKASFFKGEDVNTNSLKSADFQRFFNFSRQAVYLWPSLNRLIYQ